MTAAVAAVLTFAPSAVASDAVTYQENPQHTGAVDDQLRPPLGIRWARDMGGQSSYPVIAGGRVFVTTKTTEASYGTTLTALDAATGNVLWSRQLAHTYYWSAPAYDNGRLFVLDYDGVLQAFAPDTGAALWGRQLPGQYAFSSAPVATGGVVYTGGAGSGGTLYAVSEDSGAVPWTASVENGDDSSPSVDADHVYVSYACNQAYSFARAGGGLAWHHSTGCEGGGGKTTVLYDGKLYIRDSGGPNLILDAATGTELGAFGSQVAPAFSSGVGLYLASGTLAAERTTGRVPMWSFRGDRGLVSAPVVAGNTVFEGSSTGGLFALDRDSGSVLWSDCLAGAVAPPDEQNVSQPLTGMSVGDGILAVPAGRFLVAYEPRAGAPSYVCGATAPSPVTYNSSPGGTAPGSTGTPAAAAPGSQGGGVTLVPGRRNIRFGDVVTLNGTAAPGAKVDLLSDPQPSSSFAIAKSATAGSDGRFSFRVKPSRNTSFKAVSGGAESVAVLVNVDVDASLVKRLLSDGRLRIRATVLGPRDLPYGGKPLFFYVVKGNLATRIGSQTLRGKLGSFHASLTKRIAGATSKTHVAACLRERTPDVWGRAVAVDRSCGARRLRLP